MKLIVRNSLPEPIYAQIIAQVEAQVLDGSLPEGSPLPSIRSLARELGVSIITTKRAYEDLERAGLVDTVAGKGSFVARLAGRRDSLRQKGLMELLRPPAEAAVRLGVAPEELSTMLTEAYKEALDERARG